MKQKLLKKISSSLAVAAVFSMVFTGCGESDEALVEVEESLVAVETEAAYNSTIKRELVYGGQVQPNETVDVTSKLSGQVETINFDVGDHVNKGDVLFTLDKKDIQDQIKQLEAQLNVSNASLKSAQVSFQQVDGGQSESQIVSMQSSIENAKDAMDNAQIQLDNAKIQMENAALSVETSKANLDDVEKTFNNMKVLYNAGTVSKTEFDSAQLGYTQSKSAYDQAVNAYSSAQNAYEQAKVSVNQTQTAYNQAQESYNIYVNKITQENKNSAQTGVETAAASKQSVETQLQILRTTLNDTAVIAPISGVISSKNISETNMVSAQSAPFTIVDNSVVTVEVNVSEKIINALSVGQEVDVYIKTISEDVVKGRIKTISPSVDSTKTYPVKIEITNNDGSIKPGMFAEIHFVESQKENTIVVPRNTVIENETEKYVFVVQDGKAERRVVEVGIDNGESIEIVSGVDIGEEIIIKGQSLVQDGKNVNVVSGEDSDDGENSDQENATAKEE